MGNPIEEKAVFTGFLAAEPLFAGVAVATWSQPTNDPPDVECYLIDGRKIDFELASWVDESQMNVTKGDEKRQSGFRELLQWEPNSTENFLIALLSEKTWLRSGDEGAFRSEILALIDQLDKAHSGKPEWEQLPSFQWTDFSGFPTLKRYLDALEIHPREAAGRPNRSLSWITFEPPGGCYSPQPMVDALVYQIRKKINKYSAKPTGSNVFHLLIHYDKAFANNTPVTVPGFGYKEAVHAAAKIIGPERGVFETIFVYVGLSQYEKVFRLID